MLTSHFTSSHVSELSVSGLPLGLSGSSTLTGLEGKASKVIGKVLGALGSPLLYVRWDIKLISHVPVDQWAGWAVHSQCKGLESMGFRLTDEFGRGLPVLEDVQLEPLDSGGRCLGNVLNQGGRQTTHRVYNPSLLGRPSCCQFTCLVGQLVISSWGNSKGRFQLVAKNRSRDIHFGHILQTLGIEVDPGGQRIYGRVCLEILTGHLYSPLETLFVVSQ